jgi:Lactonase, 7-bladed beta-propeller
VSSFRVTASGLKLADRVTSGGVLPISLTSNGHLLYVLNELSGRIFGLRVSSRGHLTPIADSQRALSTAGPSGVAAAIGFAPGGHVLAVTERARGVIDTVRVRCDGSPGPAQHQTAGAPQPFAFGFAGSHLELSNAGFARRSPAQLDPSQLRGSVLSFDLTGGGALVATGNVASGGTRDLLARSDQGRPVCVHDKHAVGHGVRPHDGKGAISRFRSRATAS